MVELRRQLQVAADVSAHEHATDPMRKEQPALQLFCRASVEDCTIDIKQSVPDVSIQACAPYSPYLGPIYTSLGVSFGGFTVVNGALQLCASSVANAPICHLPDPSSFERWRPVQENCPEGYVGLVSYEREEKQTHIVSMEVKIMNLRNGHQQAEQETK